MGYTARLSSSGMATVVRADGVCGTSSPPNSVSAIDSSSRVGESVIVPDFERAQEESSVGLSFTRLM